MKTTRRNFLAIGAMLAVANTAMACPLAYAVNFSGQFGVIDLATGAFTPVGVGLENTPDGIAGAPGGPFYTVDGVTGHLIRIGLDGKVTDVGDTRTGPNTGPNGISIVGALTDGTLYALDFSNKLYRINPNTATLSLIGLVPDLPAQEPEYTGNMTTSMNGDATNLYFTIEISEGPRRAVATLFVINPNTLAATKRVLNLPSRVIGSGLVNNVFYVFGEAGEIVKLHTGTGATTVVAAYDSGLTADTPPLTGIFGVIGALEPNQVHPASPNAAKAASTRSRAQWPPRFAPLPARARQ